MPVSRLFCEGKNGGIDAVVLSKLLSGLCEVRPAGGKSQVGSLVRTYRTEAGTAVVYAIVDRDFPTQSDNPKEWGTNQPSRWNSTDGVHLGWTWERLEIENYLIDPSIVAKVLADRTFDIIGYTKALEASRDAICTYQAARASLSWHRPKFSRLESSFGKERGKDNHPFPEDLSEDECIKGLKQTVCNYSECRSVDIESVLSKYQQLKNEYCIGGIHYEHYLYAFSGKDLLLGLTGAMPSLGFGNSSDFLRAIEKGIDNTSEEVYLWDEEWKELRAVVESF